MRNLRPCPNGQRYCIPHGGLFEYVTMGSYLSELLLSVHVPRPSGAWLADFAAGHFFRYLSYKECMVPLISHRKTF